MALEQYAIKRTKGPNTHILQYVRLSICSTTEYSGTGALLRLGKIKDTCVSGSPTLPKYTGET